MGKHFDIWQCALVWGKVFKRGVGFKLEGGSHVRFLLDDWLDVGSFVFIFP